MKSLFIAAASAAITDAQTNSLSLIEIVEAFEVPQLPVLVPRLTLAWLTSKDDSDPEVSEYSVELINCGDKSVFPLSVDYKGRSRHRAVIQFQGIALNTPGNLEIRIVSSVGNRKKTIDSLSIPIILQGSQPAQAVVVDDGCNVAASKKSRKK